MSQTDNFPTAVSMQQCLEKGQCGPSVSDFVGRTGLMLLGLSLAGAKNPLPKALAASASVQAFVAGWVLVEGNTRLPSGIAAQQGNLPSIVYTYLARSAIASVGLSLSGQSDRLVVDSLAAVAPIEAAVLLWSYK